MLPSQIQSEHPGGPCSPSRGGDFTQQVLEARHEFSSTKSVVWDRSLSILTSIAAVRDWIREMLSAVNQCRPASLRTTDLFPFVPNRRTKWASSHSQLLQTWIRASPPHASNAACAATSTVAAVYGGGSFGPPKKTQVTSGVSTCP